MILGVQKYLITVFYWILGSIRIGLELGCYLLFNALHVSEFKNQLIFSTLWGSLWSRMFDASRERTKTKTGDRLILLPSQFQDTAREVWSPSKDASHVPWLSTYLPWEINNGSNLGSLSRKTKPVCPWAACRWLWAAQFISCKLGLIVGSEKENIQRAAVALTCWVGYILEVK